VAERTLPRRSVKPVAWERAGIPERWAVRVSPEPAVVEQPPLQDVLAPQGLRRDEAARRGAAAPGRRAWSYAAEPQRARKPSPVSQAAEPADSQSPGHAEQWPPWRQRPERLRA
jgi:hypothetical protein